MNSNQLKAYKSRLDTKNSNYAKNAAYYSGKNPTILGDVKKDQYGNTEKQDRRIPLPIARKLINTVVGFQFSDIVYSETGASLSTEMNFTNLTRLNNTTIEIEEQTNYFKYIKSVFDFNDNDILTIETAIEACNQGRAYKIFYFADQMLKIDTVPSNQILPIYTDTLNPQLKGAIRFYSDKIIDDKGDEKEVFYADRYTAAGVEHHKGSQADYSDAAIVKEKSVTYDKKNNIPPIMHVVEYSMFRNKMPLIEHMQGMIDEADRIISKSMAEELASSAAAILLTSFVFDRSFKDSEGKTMYDRFKESNIMENFSKDSDFAEWISKSVQSEFIFGTYDRLKKDIFELCDVPNFSDAESWGNTISGVSAGYRLLGFLFLCNQVFRVFSEGLRAEIDILNAYTELLGGSENVKKTMNYIKVTANRVLPKNVYENAQIASLLKGTLSKKTLYKLFPELVDNADEEVKASDAEDQAKTNRLMSGLTEISKKDEKPDPVTEEEPVEDEKKTA